MSIMHCVNNNSNLVKYYTFSLLDTFQSKERGSGWKNVNNIFYLIDLAEKVLGTVVSM